MNTILVNAGWRGSLRIRSSRAAHSTCSTIWPGDKFFNKTDPQLMSAETLPPEFDLAAGHQLPGSLAVPLASFPEGDYHLEVKITDKVSGKSVNRDVTFSVAAQ